MLRYLPLNFHGIDPLISHPIQFYILKDIFSKHPPVMTSHIHIYAIPTLFLLQQDHWMVIPVHFRCTDDVLISFSTVTLINEQHLPIANWKHNWLQYWVLREYKESVKTNTIIINILYTLHFSDKKAQDNTENLSWLAEN